MKYIFTNAYVKIHDTNMYRRVPAQDAPFDLILCYIAETIPNLLE